MNLDMPIQIKNSEIIKQKKNTKQKRNQILGYFSLGDLRREPLNEALAVL